MAETASHKAVGFRYKSFVSQRVAGRATWPNLTPARALWAFSRGRLRRFRSVRRGNAKS